MTENKMYGLRFMPALIGIALLCVMVAVALLSLTVPNSSNDRDQVSEINQVLALSQKIPAQASAAITGNAQAFDALSEARSQFASAVSTAGGDVQSFAGTTELLKQSQAVLGAREPMQAVQKASTETRTLVPQLLQSLGNIASALGSPNVDGMTRHLERFELTGLRLQQDMEALANGVGDTTVIARRLADGNDYMGQVVGGLGGEDSGLGLPKVTGAEGEAQYKMTSALYAQLSERVRTGISSADRVHAARVATSALAEAGDQVYAKFQTRVGVPNNAAAGFLSNKWFPVLLLAAAAIS